MIIINIIYIGFCLVYYYKHELCACKWIMILTSLDFQTDSITRLGLVSFSCSWLISVQFQFLPVVGLKLLHPLCKSLEPSGPPVDPPTVSDKVSSETVSVEGWRFITAGFLAVTLLSLFGPSNFGLERWQQYFW